MHTTPLTYRSTSFLSLNFFHLSPINSNPIPQPKKRENHTGREMQRGEEHQNHQEQESKDSPSFRLVQMDSPERISAVHDSHRTDHDDDEDDDDFEFSFIPIPEARPPIAADGKIQPVYPIFNRNLLLNLEDEPQKKEEAEGKEESKSIRLPLRHLFIEEEREQASFSSISSSASASSSSPASSSLDEFDGIAPGTYCVWTPPSKNDRCKKSNSTGSSSPSRRWRLRDLVLGRSQSDGKEKFLFIPIQGEDGSSKKKLEKNNSSNQGKKSSTEAEEVTAHRRMTTTTQYGQRNGQEVGSGAGRKSFLPYRQDLVGFLANVNGLRRGHNPVEI